MSIFRGDAAIVEIFSTFFVCDSGKIEVSLWSLTNEVIWTGCQGGRQYTGASCSGID